MHVPDTGWTPASWNGKRKQFGLLGQMIGLPDRPSSEQLQEALGRVASAKVFAESVEAFMAETAERWPNRQKQSVPNELEHINKKLGLMDPIPFRSMLYSQLNPSDFEGVAIWPAGTVGWMELRWQQIKMAEQAGATFEKIIVLGSSRICDSDADRRHPYIRGTFTEGREPTERELMKQWIRATGHLDSRYVFPELPEGDNGRPLSLSQQLRYVHEHDLQGYLTGSRNIYVPANPNALYVPLHVRRVLGISNVFFSQAGARLVKRTPDWWWPNLQDVMTTPSGILRLWIELEAAGCLTY